MAAASAFTPPKLEEWPDITWEVKAYHYAGTFKEALIEEHVQECKDGETFFYQQNPNGPWCSGKRDWLHAWKR